MRKKNFKGRCEKRKLPKCKEREVTEKITELRKRLKYAKEIEERSVRIDERMNDLYESERSVKNNKCNG